jgi:hypothetical protein
VSTSPTLDAALVPCDRFVIVDCTYERPDGTTYTTKAARCYTPDGTNLIGIVGNERFLRGFLKRHGLREEPSLLDVAVAS